MIGFFLKKMKDLENFGILKEKLIKKRKNIYKLNNLIKDVLYE